MGIILALVSALGYSSNYVLLQIGRSKSKEDNGVLLSLTSCVLTIFLLYLIALMVRQSPPAEFSWLGFFYFLVAGLFTAFLGRLLLIGGIYRIGSSRAAGIKNSAPVFTIIIAVSFMGEKISLLAGVGMLVIFTALFIQARHDFSKTFGNGEMDKKTGFLMAFGSAVSFGLGQAARKLGVMHYEDPFMGALVASTFAILILVIGEAYRKQLGASVRRIVRSLNWYYVMAGAVTGIAQVSFFVSVMLTHVSYTSVVAATEPVITVLLGILFLKSEERITPRLIITACCVFIGTVILVLAP